MNKISLCSVIGITITYRVSLFALQLINFHITFFKPMAVPKRLLSLAGVVE